MPHAIIEYSAGLDDDHDIHALCESTFDALAGCGVFGDPAAIKVRALPCPYFVLGSDPQSFAHVTVRLLPGRTGDQKASVTQAVLKALQAHLSAVGSLSVDIADLDAAYAKRTL